MKKLALSVVLTLGVSGFALANNGNTEKEKQSVKKEHVKKEAIEKKATPEKACSHYFRLDVVDCEGVKHKGETSNFSGSCDGTPNGGMIMHSKTIDMGDLGLC